MSTPSLDDGLLSTDLVSWTFQISFETVPPCLRRRFQVSQGVRRVLHRRRRRRRRNYRTTAGPGWAGAHAARLWLHSPNGGLFPYYPPPFDRRGSVDLIWKSSGTHMSADPTSSRTVVHVHVSDCYVLLLLLLPSARGEREREREREREKARTEKVYSARACTRACAHTRSCPWDRLNHTGF